MSVNCTHEQCINSYECKAIRNARVELHPSTDRWMMGDRYGIVVRELPYNMVRVILDKSQKAFTYKLSDIGRVLES